MKHFFYFTAAAVAFLVINGCEQIPPPSLFLSLYLLRI